MQKNREYGELSNDEGVTHIAKDLLFLNKGQF